MLRLKQNVTDSTVLFINIFGTLSFLKQIFYLFQIQSVVYLFREKIYNLKFLFCFVL
jgi:hypothetical protein